MARVTGLEPATSGVTGRRSNRLSYTRAIEWAANYVTHHWLSNDQAKAIMDSARFYRKRVGRCGRDLLDQAPGLAATLVIFGATALYGAEGDLQPDKSAAYHAPYGGR